MSKVGFNIDPPKLALFGLCNNDRYVYMFGGRNSDEKIESSLDNCVHYNDLWEYNIELNTIECIEIINIIKPDRRSSMTLNYYDNNLFLFGGYTHKGSQRNDVWKFSIKYRNWHRYLPVLQNRPHKRSDHKSVVYNHYLIIFGGVYFDRSWRTCFKDIWYFNMKTKIWKHIECDNKPLGRYAHGMILCNNNIIINGGYDVKDKSLNDTYFISVKDVTNNNKPKWIKIDCNMDPLSNHLFLTYNNKFSLGNIYYVIQYYNVRK